MRVELAAIGGRVGPHVLAAGRSPGLATDRVKMSMHLKSSFLLRYSLEIHLEFYKPGLDDDCHYEKNSSLKKRGGGRGGGK
jgi:hypothetical protein